MQIISITPERKKYLAIGAAAVLVASVGGILIGRTMGDDTSVAVTAKAGEEEGHEEGAEGREEHREGFVEMTPERMQASGVVTERITPGAIRSEIIAQANVTATRAGQGLLTARADGAVVRINKGLGDYVNAGETVALLESRDAAAFVAEVNAASARAQQARAAAARERRLFNARITARQDLEAADAARAIAEADLQRAQAAVRAAGVTGGGRYLAVTSPISGRITEVDTQLGAYVSAGTELFNVSNPRNVQVEAAVPAASLVNIHQGDPAVIELPNGDTLEAVVGSITPSLNAESRAATVVLQPRGVPAGLTQGQAVRVRITPQGTALPAIVLPEEAVQQVEGRDVVFVQVEGGFQARPVSTGQRTGGRVEILSGLEPGMTVVTRGAFVLKSQLGASEAEH